MNLMIRPPFQAGSALGRKSHGANVPAVLPMAKMLRVDAASPHPQKRLAANRCQKATKVRP
jgi:hypothetical protein